MRCARAPLTAAPAPPLWPSSIATTRKSAASTAAIATMKVVSIGPAALGRTRLQVERPRLGGTASGKAQNPATDHSASMPSPPRTARPASATGRMAAGRIARSVGNRRPPEAARRRAAPAHRSRPSQARITASVVRHCRSAPAEASKRSDRSGSFIQTMSRTASGGGVEGPRISATSTTEEEKAATAITGRRIWR